jgi:regulator of cell morphogenesis and NO signaling
MKVFTERPLLKQLIMTNISEQTLASLVTQHHQTAGILEKYNLDFCCKGKRTLAAACEEKNISLENILAELELFTAPEEKLQMPFEQMTAEQLIGYILIHHHFYVKQSMPTIYGHLEKVVNKHGDRYPCMISVFQLFTAVKEEMTSHMQKEEMILFPRIKEVEKAVTENNTANTAGGYITGPINVMETEHEHAGELLYEIRRLTNNYTAPEDACTTFKVCIDELKAFEEDLHQHVHLENNVLFPLAEKFIAA